MIRSLPYIAGVFIMVGAAGLGHLSRPHDTPSPCLTAVDVRCPGAEDVRAYADSKGRLWSQWRGGPAELEPGSACTAYHTDIKADLGEGPWNQ